MWIKAFRLREVGKFATDYAVEGLTPGLNVLSGPNEHGKSTLLRALRVLFEFSHTSNHASVRGLRPYSGGAPQIECEFNLAGQDWSLKKQFLTSRSAELRCQSGGQLYRGGDVDSALNDLIVQAAGSLETLKSQWVAQGDGFRPPRASAETVTTVQNLVSQEVSAATGGDQLDMIVEKVSDQLSTLITAKSRKPKAGGPLHEAQRALQSISLVCDELREKEQTSAQRQSRFNEIAAILGDTKTVDELAKLKGEILARRANIEASQERLAQCELATERRRRQAAELDTAEAAYASFAEQLRIFDTRRARLGEIGQSLQELSSVKEGKQKHLAQLTAHLVELEAQQDVHRRQALLREQQRRYAGLMERMTDIRQRCATAQTLTDKLTQIKEQLIACPLSRAIHDQATALKRDAERLSIELRAQSATLDVVYLPDQKGSFLIGAEELSDGATIAIDQPVTVEVPGIGRLRIAPGHRQEIAQLRRRFDENQRSIAALLSSHDFESIDHLEIAWRDKGQLEVEQSHLSDSLRQIAPEGAVQLHEMLSRLERQVEEAKPESPKSYDDEAEMVPETGDLSSQVEQSSKALKSLQYDIARQDEREKQLLHEQQVLSEQIEHVSEPELLDVAVREKRSNDLQETIRLAKESLNLIVRQEHALLEGAPSRKDIDQGIHELEELERTVDSRENRQAALSEEANILEGALRRDAEDGLGVQVAEAHDQRCVAQTKVDDLLMDVAALGLLEQELSVISDDRQRLITEPVMRRIARIGEPLFGDATFGLGDALELKSIGRSGVEETVDAVSDGTREQISVLARLAFGGLLAEGGYSLPLVLDDPFVYADDRRLAGLFLILQDMATRHQCIVLTCHERSFAPLAESFGANEVRISNGSEYAPGNANLLEP